MVSKWLRRFIIIIAGVFFYLSAKNWMNTWGTVAGEPDEPLPDDWVIGDKHQATRAITIRKAPVDVWPWLAQFGHGAGLYACDYIMNGGRSSADYLLDEPAPLIVGNSHPKLGKVAGFEKEHYLTWIRMGMKLPFLALDFRLTFYLHPFGIDHTRMIIRSSMDWHGKAGCLYLPFLELIEFSFVCSLLHNLKDLVEDFDFRKASSRINKHLSGQHQADLISLG